MWLFMKLDLKKIFARNSFMLLMLLGVANKLKACSDDEMAAVGAAARDIISDLEAKLAVAIAQRDFEKGNVRIAEATLRSFMVQNRWQRAIAAVQLENQRKKLVTASLEKLRVHR